MKLINPLEGWKDVDGDAPQIGDEILFLDKYGDVDVRSRIFWSEAFLTPMVQIGSTSYPIWDYTSKEEFSNSVKIISR